MEKPKYIDWLIEEENITIKDGIPLKCFKLTYEKNDDILDEWALHIRRNYIDDITLIEDADINSMTIEEYLYKYIIPQKNEVLGPTARAGDLSEILISDLLEFILNYSVPRYRLVNRSGKNNSQQGTDVIAYKFYNENKTADKKDVLIATEVKANLTSKEYTPIKNAIIDSQKDEHRLARSINYCRKRLNELGKNAEANEITRFLLKTENPFKVVYGAAGISSQETVASVIELDISEEDLVISSNQMIFYIHGKKLMDLTHNLYERCKK